MQERLRAALTRLHARDLGQLCGVSAFTISRAAAGQRVMRANGAAIASGLAKLEKGGQP